MNNAKHTPGPWEIDVDTRPVEVCTIYGVPPQGEDGQRFIYVRGAIGDWDATEETNLANAHLIAAAPELLEALKGVLRIADRKTDEFDAARAAIAKATGAA